MKKFDLTLNEQNYQINVIGPMDKYGEDNKTHYYEIPLIEFKSENSKTVIHEIIDVLDLESDLSISDNGNSLSLDDRKKINDELTKLYPASYLNVFLSLKKTRKPKM